MKILIVDDASFMRATIRKALNLAGYEDIVEAIDGEDAVVKYVSERPDLVFLDINMPLQNGLLALKNILHMDNNAKVVICSALGQERYLVDAIAQGAYDFIIKPFRTDRLINIIQRIGSDKT